MIAFILLIIINLMILNSVGGDAAGPVAKKNGEWTVHGTMGCSWTVKQLDHMKKNGISHNFVDCDKNGGCPGMQGFPTLTSPDGEQTVGFKEV